MCFLAASSEVFRHGCALIDPGLEQCDLIRAQAFAFRGHHFIGIMGEDFQDEQAFSAFAGNNCGFTRIAAFEQRWFHVHSQGGFLLLRAVAFQTATLEQRLNVPDVIDFGEGSASRRFGCCGKAGYAEAGGRKSQELQEPMHVSVSSLCRWFAKNQQIFLETTITPADSIKSKTSRRVARVRKPLELPELVKTST